MLTGTGYTQRLLLGELATLYDSAISKYGLSLLVGFLSVNTASSPQRTPAHPHGLVPKFSWGFCFTSHAGSVDSISSINLSQCRTKTHIEGLDVRTDTAAVTGAEFSGLTESVTTTAKHPMRPGSRTLGMNHAAGRVITVPIEAPFPDVAHHILKSPSVSLFSADGMGVVA